MKDPSILNRRIVALHDQLKALVLVASHDFPKQVSGGFALLENVAELQTGIAAYAAELLVRLFEPTGRGPGNGSRFIELWLRRAEPSTTCERPEGELDAAVRDLVALLCQETRLMTEEQLRAAVESDDDLPEMLYYLSTVQGSLSWYLERYLWRMAGPFRENAGS